LIKAYYLLAKPGIIYGNALTAIGGYFLAAKGTFDLSVFLSMLFGLSFVIGSACVFNNIMDQGIDSKMARTKKRALVRKTIPEFNAVVYGSILGIIGLLLLLSNTNVLTALIAFIGFIFYVIVYGIFKRKSVHGTVIGSISGAVPPVVGYCAVTNNLDLGALFLFIILVIWQMPHFYAIAIFRHDDYTAASIPVLPVKKGLFQTKIQMVMYIVAFIIVDAFLFVFHYTGYTYLIVMTLLGLIWLGMTLRGFNTIDKNRWAREIFFFSLILITIFSLLLIGSSFLP
jgi:protoheme IX farnesyltransferase